MKYRNTDYTTKISECTNYSFFIGTGIIDSHLVRNKKYNFVFTFKHRHCCSYTDHMTLFHPLNSFHYQRRWQGCHPEEAQQDLCTLHEVVHYKRIYMNYYLL